jgi:single-stranded DNA-binding protein
MSAHFNEVLIIGDYHKRIEDIQLKSGSVGVQVVVLCVNEYYDKNGSRRTKPEHIAVTGWGKTGEVLASRFGPGDKMLIRASLSGREYNERYYTQVNANLVQHFEGHVSADASSKRKREPEPVASEPDTGTAATKPKEEDSDLPF